MGLQEQFIKEANETAYLKENLERRVGRVEDAFYNKVMEEK